jgi:prophage regulatory protein
VEVRVPDLASKNLSTGRLLRRPEVERETGLSRSSIYRLMDEGKFPRPRRTGHRAVAWPSVEIDAWKASRPFADAMEV